MKRVYLYIVISISALLASCDIVTSDNGKLDGVWQLRTVENLRTEQTSDGRDKAVQWAFQGDLLMLKANTGTDFTDVFCRFRHAGNTLELSTPYFSGRFLDDVNDDVAVEDATSLTIYGIYQLEERFQVLELNSDVMVLQSDSVCLHFRKY